MLTVNVRQLVSAIEEADVFRLPDMNRGTRYLYDRVYGCLSEGRELRLSDVDFGGFELEDIDSMRELYSETLECNGSKADALGSTSCSQGSVCLVFEKIQHFQSILITQIKNQLQQVILYVIM